MDVYHIYLVSGRAPAPQLALGRRGGRGPSNPPHCLAEPFPQREGSVRRRAPNTYWGLGPGQRARIASLRRWPQSVPETKAQSHGVWSGRPAQRQLQGGELLHAALRVWGAPAPKLCESQSSFSRNVSCCDLTPGRPGSTQVAASSPTGQAGLSHLRTVPNKKQAPSLGDRSAQLAPCLPVSPQTREDDESPGCCLIASCPGRGRRGEKVISYKTRSGYLSLPVLRAGGTQQCFSFPFAASIKIPCFLLVLLSPHTNLGVLGDTRFDTWPLS